MPNDEVTSPDNLSSVSIETMAKGLPKVTVKVYDESVTKAAQRAIKTYYAVRKELAEKEAAFMDDA